MNFANNEYDERKEISKIIPLQKLMNNTDPYHVGYLTFEEYGISKQEEFEKPVFAKPLQLYPPTVYFFQSVNTPEQQLKNKSQLDARLKIVYLNYNIQNINILCRALFNQNDNIEEIIMKRMQLFLEWQKRYKCCCLREQKFWVWVYTLKNKINKWNIWLEWVMSFIQFRNGLLLWVTSFQQLIIQQQVQVQVCRSFFRFAKKYLLLKRMPQPTKAIKLTILLEEMKKIFPQVQFFPPDYQLLIPNHLEQKPMHIPFYFPKLERRVTNNQWFQIFKIQKMQSISKLNQQQ